MRRVHDDDRHETMYKADGTRRTDATVLDAAVAYWVDELRVRTGTHVGDTPVPLSVSLNGQQFVDVLESLTYVFEGP